MYSWITIAEWAALIFSIVLIVNVYVDSNNVYIRQRVARSTYFSVFISIAFTLLSTYTLLYLEYLPIQLVDIITFIYFLALPLPYVLCLRYAQCLLYFKTSQSSKISNWAKYWVPYLLYFGFVLSNFIFRHIYSLTEENGYSRELFYQSPYLVGVGYFVFIVYTLFKCHKVIGKRNVLVLMVTITISLCLVLFQFIFTNLMLLGTANMIIAVTIHLNIQNSNKDIDKRTGLLNRDVLISKMQHKIKSNSNFSLYIFSLREFKNINERIGLQFGDFVLEEISANLLKIFDRENVFRYKGDEFAVTTTRKQSDVEQDIKKAVEMFLAPFHFEEITSTLNMVYARVDYPSFGDDVNSIISAADYSISTAKNSNDDDIFIYDVSIREKMAAKLDMQAHIKKCIENKDIIVYYQPIYSAVSDSYIGAEALVRLRGEDNSIIPPNSFIGIAEETGLIVDLTYLILERVCIDLAAMDRESDISVRSVSINFPYIQFLQSDVVERIEKILTDNNILPKRIKIEITERTLISNHHKINDVINQLQKLGFKLEVDDFGVEYSNLSLLLRIPFDILKVDRSLVLEVLKREENKQFFCNFLKGIRAINKLVIVEGIETAEQFAFMKDCFVELYQGYYFSPPLPLNDFLSFIKNKKSIDNL